MLTERCRQSLGKAALTTPSRSPSLPRMSGLTYRDAGVDIEAADRLVDRIKPLAASTRTSLVVDDVGGFAGLCKLPDDIHDPILVSGTDGVGTKLKLAFELKRHDTVGIDLVAMCVNDVITTGATPLFFLDYFATGDLDVDQGEAVVRGIAEGCRQAGCALIGGETAELPGFYAKDEYELAGFSVGVVSRSKIIDGSAVRKGDAVIGVASSGLHSNGYSLARKALLEGPGPISLQASVDGYAETLGDVLLTPTLMYAKMVSTVVEHSPGALCHITGGGLPGNLPRVLPKGLGVVLDRKAWTVPPIFDLIATRGRVQELEMFRTFNMGIGFVIVVDEASASRVVNTVTEGGFHASQIGQVVESSPDERVRII